MLEKLVTFSVQQRGVVLVATALLSLVGLWQASRLAIDAVPDVTNVQVTVLTSSAGLSPLEVEQYLTYPIEMSLNGLPNLTQLRSVSLTGVSAVTAVFDDSINVWFARQIVAERLKQAESEIPSGYGKPELAPVATALGDIFEFVLYSERHSPMELRTALDWTIAPRLRQVPGVIEVNARGGEVKQYQIVVDPQNLKAHRLSFNQVVRAVSANNRSVGGGYVEKSSENLVIRGDGLVHSEDDLRRIVVSTDSDGTPVLLGGLATVQIGPALKFGSVTQLGRGPVVTGTVMMLAGSNSREVVGNVKAAVAKIQKDLPDGMRIEAFYDRADFIDRVLRTVFINLGEGAALVVIVLLVALGTVKGALAAALAIPVSMLLAVIGMRALGVVGNVMSLGAIDFGLLVDGCIVMLESVLVQLALKRPDKAHLPQAVAEATSQVARPVAFSVAIILLVYLPLMALEGVEGKMFRPMAVTVALALGGALIFSLTAFPALLSYVAPVPKGEHHEGRIMTFLQATYARGLDMTLGFPRASMATAALLFVGAMVLATRLGADFVPRIFEGAFVVDVRRLPSVSITESQRLGELLEKELSSFPEVRGVVTRTGRAEVPTDPVGPDSAEVMVTLAPRSEWQTAQDPDDLASLMKEKIETSVPGTFPAMSQPIENRVNELLAGSRADVVVKVFGHDLVTLKSIAEEIGSIMREVPGTGDLRVQRVLGLPLLEAKVDRVDVSRLGLSADDVLDVVEASRVGKTVGKVFEGPRRFDIVAKLPLSGNAEDGLSSLLVSGGNGQLVPLAQVADVRRTEGPSVVNREGLERRVVVEVNVRGRDLVSYVQDAQVRVANTLKLPEGYSITWGGQFENFSRAAARLGMVVPMALVIIFGMLFLMFGEVRLATAVFVAVPLALIGGIVALWLRGLTFSIPAGVGFIALCGVAVLNGVVMTSELVRRLEESDFDTALRATARTVLRPVLTTAAVAAIGFVPMAISSNPGSEVQRPLATVVIGGMISATILKLLILPVVLRALCRPNS